MNIDRESIHTSVMTCVFCEIISGTMPSRKIWEDDEFVAFFPLKQINPGHVLLVPKRHVDYLFDLPDEIYNDLWETARALAEPIRRVTQSKRVGIAVEGFTVPHVHVHLVPVNSGNELDPNRARALSNIECARMQRELSEALKSPST